MKAKILGISLIALLAFGQQAMGIIEMSTSGQYFVIATTANGFDQNGELVGDQNRSAFGTILYGEQGSALSSTCPGGYATAGISVESWRTNSLQDTYAFAGSFEGEAALAQADSCAGSLIEYRQIYEFSVNTTTGGTETVTIDVSELNAPAISPGINFSGLQASLSRNGIGYDFDLFYNPGVSVFELPNGDYRLSLFVCSASPPGYGDAAFAVSWKHKVRFSNLTSSPGSHHDLPVIKDPASRFCYDFRAIPKATWVGAMPATELSFQMIGNSAFAGIMGLPPGYTNQFEVVTGNSSLGFFSSNQPVDFVTSVGHPVRSFEVRNIAPVIEGSVSNTFAIMLNYDTPTADFVMIPVPGLTVLRETNGTARVFFAGALEQSTNLTDWIEVPGSPASPYLVTPTTSPAPTFFRSRRQ